MKLLVTGDSVDVGTIVAVQAYDWGMYNDQHPRVDAYKIVKATVYGEVIGHTADGDGLVIAPQVFEEGDVRCTLVIPWCTVRRIYMLGTKDELPPV
jgi:hypothetical protein